MKRRAAMGWLVHVFHGVWGIGHPPRTHRGWCFAALLAGGERSVLSHTTAAAVHRMASSSRRLHLTVPRSAKGIEGIRTHRPRTLRPEDIVVVDGLRVTSPSRTLIDLADFRRRRLLERVIDQAEFHQLHLPLGDVHDRLRRRPRGALLRSVITEHVAGSTITESEAEECFLAIVRAAGLPQPASQRHLWGRRRDFLFPEARVVVEVDGRRAHDRDGAFERDALRDAEVVVNGYRPLRFTRRAVKFDQGYVAAVLKRVLLAVASVIALAGCGGGQATKTATQRTPAPTANADLALPAHVPRQASGPANPAELRVIARWLRTLRSGDERGAARYWATGAKFQNATPVLTIDTPLEKLAIQKSLPCGAKIRQAGGPAPFVVLVFVLTRRPGGDCGTGVGHTARGAIRVAHGRIVEWYRLPDATAPQA